MRRLVSLWPAAASALLVWGAFPPLNFGLLVLVGLVPLLIALMKEERPKRAVGLGYTFGFVYMLLQLQMMQALVARWTGYIPLSFVPWVLGTFIAAWYFALFGWLANRAFRSGVGWLVPIVWGGVEVFRSYIPALAFPWGLIADPLWFLPQIIQPAYFGSIFLVSVWVAAINQIIALWQSGAGFIRIRPYLLATVLVLGLSIVRFASPEPFKKMVITAGQPGADMAFSDPKTIDERLGLAVNLIYAAAKTNGTQLLVLPEGISEAPNGLPPNAPFSIDPAIPVILGGKRGSSPAYQSAFAFDGKRWSYADKTRLVIFGEYVPGRNWIPFLSAFELPSGDLAPGEKLGTLDVGGVTAGPLICFEELFPDLAYRQAQSGAQVLTVLSIDDWYMGTSAPAQLRSSSVWRAVETGLPLVRAASLGSSLAVDTHGRIITEAPLGQRFPLRAEVPIPDEAEPFPLFPLFPALMLVSLAAAFAAPRLAKMNLRRSPAKKA